MQSANLSTNELCVAQAQDCTNASLLRTMNESRPSDETLEDTIEDTIEGPEPAHLRDEQHASEQHASDDELEATELRLVDNDKPRLSRVITPDKPMVRWYDPFRRFWRHQIRISVPHVDCRDHLGKLSIKIVVAELLCSLGTPNAQCTITVASHCWNTGKSRIA